VGFRLKGTFALGGKAVSAENLSFITARPEFTSGAQPELSGTRPELASVNRVSDNFPVPANDFDF